MPTSTLRWVEAVTNAAVVLIRPTPLTDVVPPLLRRSGCWVGERPGYADTDGHDEPTSPLGERSATASRAVMSVRLREPASRIGG